jgi:hypothetical protein
MRTAKLVFSHEVSNNTAQGGVVPDAGSTGQFPQCTYTHTRRVQVLRCAQDDNRTEGRQRNCVAALCRTNNLDALHLVALSTLPA